MPVPAGIFMMNNRYDVVYALNYVRDVILQLENRAKEMQEDLEKIIERGGWLVGVSPRQPLVISPWRPWGDQPAWGEKCSKRAS